MAFCKYCGSSIPDGAICSCPQAQAANAQQPVAVGAVAAAPAVQPIPQQTAVPQQPMAPQQPVAPQQMGVPTAPVAPATPAAPSAIAQSMNSLLPTLKAYLSSPKAAVQQTVAEGNLPIAFVFTAVHAVVSILFFVSVLGLLNGMISGVAGLIGGLAGGMSGGLLGSSLGLKTPILQVIISGIVMTALIFGLSSLALFLLAKANKTAFSLKQAFVAVALHSLFPTALVLVGLLFGLIAWWLELLLLVAAAIIWVMNACSDAREFCGADATSSGKTMAVTTGIFLVVAAVILFAASRLIGWTISKAFLDMATTLAGGLGDLGKLSDLL